YYVASGTKVTGDNPYKIRSTQSYLLSGGLFIKTIPDARYRFRVFYHYQGEFEHDAGYKPFGESFETRDGREHFITVERTECTNMKESDVTTVNDLSLKINAIGDAGLQVRKSIDKFNIIGPLESYMTNDLTDYIQNPNTITPQELHDKMSTLVGANS